MPVIHCQCGRTTNTATARWVGSTLEDPSPIKGSLNVLALECYVAFEEVSGTRIPGCAKNTPERHRSVVAKLLASDAREARKA